MSTGLLQRIAVRHLRRSNSTATVSTERGETAHHWCSPMWSYHSGAETASLVALNQRIDFKLAVLVYKSLHGLAPSYLSDTGWLSTRHGCRTSTCQVFRRLHVCCPADTVTDWRQEFLCSRTAAMEQPTDRDPEERHYLRTVSALEHATVKVFFVRLSYGALLLLLKCAGYKHSAYSLTHSRCICWSAHRENMASMNLWITIRSCSAVAQNPRAFCQW